jgi:hypothetical protein
LAGVDSKQKQWFLGAVRGCGGFESWMTYLSQGLRNPEFLLAFEGTSDAWQRSRLVGEKISELRKGFVKLSDAERADLAKQGETELKAGLELLGRDKRTIQELIELVDPPHTQ